MTSEHFQPSARALRIMAIVRWILLALITALAAYTVWTYWGPVSSKQADIRPDRYYCPMHPQVRSPDPGQCPICHMTLERIPAERQGEATPQTMGSGPKPPDVVPVTLTGEQQKSIDLTTSLVVKESLGSRLRVPGVINAPETGISQVRIRAPGFVERVSVRQTGVRVSRGQTLAWIYSPEIYRAQEEFLVASQWRAASDAGTPMPGVPDMVPAARRSLELLGLSGADIDSIARTGKPKRAVPVRAPSSGYVTRFSAVLGSRADPEMVLYEIADLSSVWVIGSVHERDMPQLRTGMEARFSLSGREQDEVKARIDLIEPILDETTRTAKVRLVLKNPEDKLKPGQFGEISFELPVTEGLFVPRDAVIRTGEHAYVYLIAGEERFEPRSVSTGMTREGRIQILEGLREGDRVVTRGSFMLDSESRLQASLAASPSPSAGSPPSAEHGGTCDKDFDRERYPEKHSQCRKCEIQHAGMGSMASDCINAIPKPWR